MNYLLYLFIPLLLGSCEPISDNQTVTRADLEIQLQKINAFVDNAVCLKDDQCSYMAYGSKACGGPKGYLVFSSSIDINALKLMVKKYTEDESIYNRVNGIMSDCSMANPPQKVGCVNGKCTEVD
ncbi:hypothetical protein BH23BAC2_BH23BAC2_22960 [soil metagenome]